MTSFIHSIPCNLLGSNTAPSKSTTKSRSFSTIIPSPVLFSAFSSRRSIRTTIVPSPESALGFSLWSGCLAVCQGDQFSWNVQVFTEILWRLVAARNMQRSHFPSKRIHAKELMQVNSNRQSKGRIRKKQSVQQIWIHTDSFIGEGIIIILPRKQSLDISTRSQTLTCLDNL